MRRVIVGTAGHIDHGKTSLVQALTGIDCDRWEEEKSRGITIDLGFAHLDADDLQLGFVDVPGHERFLHNALAGLGGIRVMLLVVAADEGVKPQTREHLDICRLLRIPAAVIVVTKSDLVAPDLLELAGMEIDELLEETPFSGAPRIAVSTVTGDGVDALRDELVRTATRVAREPDLSLPARLPVDRAFHLKGLGVVVTGTLVSGAISPGDALEIQPGGFAARVRGVQIHGAPRDRAVAGERTALQLTGVALEQLDRGVELSSAGSFEPTASLLARLTLLADAPAELTGWTAARIHLLASEVVGRVRPLADALAPGETGDVEIHLARPLVAVRNDRFILRRPSPPTTLGGGTILDPRWRRRRGRGLARAVQALNGDIAGSLREWILDGAEAGASTHDLATRLGETDARTEERLAALKSESRVLEIPTARGSRWIAPRVHERISRRAATVLKRYFQRERLAEGMPKAEAISRLLPKRAIPLAETYLAWLEAQGVLEVDGHRVNLPGRSAKLTTEESNLARSVTQLFVEGGLKPPSPPELIDRLGAQRQILEGLLEYLTRRGRLVLLPGGLWIARDAIDKLRQEMLDSGWETFSVGEFKDRFSLSRKWAIPLLEQLDSEGTTRRMGDVRQVVRPRLQKATPALEISE